MVASADSQVVVPPNTVIITPPAETPHDSTIIYYSVQIAAHTVPMTENHIRQNIYHGGMTIREIHEDGWYKYLIGRYTDVDEAIKLLNEVNVDKAFVVAYKNGRRVPLKEVVPDGPDSQTK